MQPTEINNLSTNFSPLPQNNRKPPVNMRYIFISFVIVFVLGAGVMVAFQLINQKSTSTISRKSILQNTSVTNTKQADQKSMPVSITPTGILQNTRSVDTSSPETVNLGNDDVALSDLQNSLQGL